MMLLTIPICILIVCLLWELLPADWFEAYWHSLPDQDDRLSGMRLYQLRDVGYIVDENGNQVKQKS